MTHSSGAPEKVSTCPSAVMWSAAGPAAMLTRTSLRDGMITGLAVSVCGEMAMMVSTSLVGVTIGPPVAREYPVEPVGVVTMMPSAA
jgi:hypothetical protein